MPITDPANSIYMSNMFVTGGNSNTNYTPSTNSTNLLGATNSQNQISGVNNSQLTKSFTELLTGMMAMNTASSLASIGDFSNSGSGSSMDNLWGMGSGLSGMSGLSELSGLTGSSDSSNMMLMLILLLALQNGNGQNSNLLNTIGSGLLGQGTTSLQQQCTHTGSEGIPANAWLASNPGITNQVGQRSASAYRSVIDQFNVESNSRYQVNKQGKNDTYCNIFVWDVTRAMGAEIPHFVDKSTGQPVSAAGANTQELNANQVNDWLKTYGTSHGWVRVSAEEAQYYANNGMPTITSWKNPSGHGHLQMVSPSVDGTYDASRGVAISQAGRQLKNYDYITSVYGSSTLPNVEYYTHV